MALARVDDTRAPCTGRAVPVQPSTESRVIRSTSMLFAVIFTDKPGLGSVRAAHLQAHIAWLEQHRDVVPAGGSLRAAPGDVPTGGLWIAQAESAAQIEALIQTDPFFMAGLRERYEILLWSKANAERKVLI